MDAAARATLVRALCLYIPVAATALAWRRRRPGVRQAAGAGLAAAWNLPALLAVHLVAERAGWWHFAAGPGAVAGIPVELYLGWALLWGPLPALAAPRVRLPLVVLGALWLDLIVMPLCAPVVELGRHWLAGEALALGAALAPGQLLARLTADGRRVGCRALLQLGAFAGLTLFVMTGAILEHTGGSWRPLLDRDVRLTSLAIQLMGIPVLLGVSAVQEFAQRGGGTPVPYDPPSRLVTSGPYAYVSNPMQLSMALGLLGWGALLGSAPVAAAGLMAFIYSAGLAAWSEGDDLFVRHGEPWRAYRAAVRPWLLRWRPWATPGREARLYVAAGCDPCSGLGRWIAARDPVGLTIAAAERHPARDLRRITYEPGDGTPDEEGVAALARALEHIHLGWAMLGWMMRLPMLRPVLQLVVDASGGEPRTVRRTARLDDGCAIGEVAI